MDGASTPGDAASTSRGLRAVALSDRFDVDRPDVLLSGVHALIRACLMQAARDRLEGWRSAGYVTGYRGSPLGAVDVVATQARDCLTAAGVIAAPALNEDVAATALWGTQQAELRGNGRQDGVFGLFYGKGPGVDRSGDVFRHANLAGVSPRGGVLVAMGDDHTCESSTTCHQSDFALIDAQMPVLHPAGPQEILDFAMIGWGLSRFTGCWVGLKCLKDTVEATSVVDGRLQRVALRRPEAPQPPEGLNIRLGESPQDQETRLSLWRLPAVAPFARANGLDRRTHGRFGARIGLVSSGKSWLDLIEALALLDIDADAAERLGLTVFKIGLAWPLEPDAIRSFASGLELMIVVEEKRALIEPQAKEALYGRVDAPAIIGKRDADGAPMLRSHLDLDPLTIAAAIGPRLIAALQRGAADSAALSRLAAAVERVEARAARLARLAEAPALAERRPYFCAGCPHNRSTVAPDDARAVAGIGCHYMALWMDRDTAGHTHMGGEGANWIGEAPFTTESHVFQNMGDGTYNHSGLMAVRAAVASGVSMTYKILYNDAVAMTGGQRNDGGLTPQKCAAELLAAGVVRLEVVGEAEELRGLSGWPAAAGVHDRSRLDAVQRDLAQTPGVTALLYVQTCAAEKRRRRRKGELPQATRRVMINPAVCEGCGDCGAVSNCVAIHPLETPFGTKRRIDQSACNQDLSCVDGLCPSFITVTGAAPRKPGGAWAAPRAALETLFDDPRLDAAPPSLDRQAAWRGVVAGVGGSGVVTIGAVLTMAAHLDGSGAAMIEMAGLAQKGGPVHIHCRVTRACDADGAIRTPPGGGDALIAGDLAVAGGPKTLGLLKEGTARGVLNTARTPTADFVRDPDALLPGDALETRVARALAPDGLLAFDAVALAERRLGDAVFANMILLGAAWRRGLAPVSAEALQEAIKLNGTAVASNLTAFDLGRLAALDANAAFGSGPESLGADAAAPPDVSALIAHRRAHLEAYQDTAWAQRFEARVAEVAAAEAAAFPGSDTLTRAAALGLSKLMSYKDEYEVARLHADNAEHLAETLFEPVAGARARPRVAYHLSPPLFTRPGPDGRPNKLRFGPWMGAVFRHLQKGKRLRGGPWDVFGWTAERRRERALIDAYEADLALIVSALAPGRLEAALALAGWPATVRGFGAVKARAMDAAEAKRAELRAAFAPRAATDPPQA